MVRRVLALILAGSVLLLLEPAWRWTSADRLVDVSPDLALARNPGHPRALEIAAARAFESGNDDRAVDLSKAAIARRPLEARSYRVLAAAYEREGRLPEARAAHLAAISVAPSDSVSQLWLASRYLSESRFADALDHIDRALRARPDLSELVFPVVAGGLQNMDFATELVNTLALQPPWRRVFLAYVASLPGHIAGAGQLFAGLAEISPLAEDEARLLIGRFERDQQWNDMRAAWDSIAIEHKPRTGMVVDGGFESNPHGFGLGWRISRVPGAISGFAPAGGSRDGGRALNLRFLDQRVAFAHVQQLMLLPKGRYILSGEAKPAGLRARRGLRWDVSCQGRSDFIAQSPVFAGTSPWKSWTLEFEVPDDCPVQWLVLRLEAIGLSEQMIGGSIALDGLRIDPAAGLMGRTGDVADPS